MIKMITQEELMKQKEKIESLSVEVNRSYEFLKRICNEISFAENLDSNVGNLSDTDKLIYILTERIVDHLTSINFLVSAYEEYSKTLERLILQVNSVKEEEIKQTK
jgi:hypothetical protein